MAAFTIELPEDVLRSVDARAAAKGYSRVEDYVRDMIVARVGEPISEALEAHLLKALESPPQAVTRQDWERKAQEVLNRESTSR